MRPYSSNKLYDLDNCKVRGREARIVEEAHDIDAFAEI